MAEELLPASLEKLEIDASRDANPKKKTRNPFSRVSNGNLKLAAVEDSILWTSLSLTGEECVSLSCKCNNRQNNTKSHSSLSWNHNHRNEHGIKPTTIFKKSILQKSKLGFLSTCSNHKHGLLPNSDCILKEPVLKLTNFPKSKLKFGVQTKPAPLLRYHNSFSNDVLRCRYSDLAPFGQNMDSSKWKDFKSLLSCQSESPTVCVDCETYSFHGLRLNEEQSRFSDSKYEEDLRANDQTAKCRQRQEHYICKNSNGQSCSQQARMTVNTSNNCDDVTIDELASYFDIFVHIPKKMSHMAEMMYI